MKTASIIVSLLLLAAFAVASPDEFGLETPPTPEAPDEILLKDGNLVTGRILEERDDVVIIMSDSLGRLEIPRDQIVNMGRTGGRTGAIADPDYNSLMFVPTPATLAKGDHYFRDFELFFLNFGGSLSDEVDISVGTLFPVSSSAGMLSLGGKVRLVDRAVSPIGLALTGSYTILGDDVKFGAFGFVAGVGDRRSSLNLAINRTFDDDGDTETVILAGADGQLTRRSKVFVEYMSSASMIENDDLDGFINVGFRLFGQSHSFSLSGFRPLTNDADGFIAFPMLVYSNHW